MKRLKVILLWLSIMPVFGLHCSIPATKTTTSPKTVKVVIKKWRLFSSEPTPELREHIYQITNEALRGFCFHVVGSETKRSYAKLQIEVWATAPSAGCVVFYNKSKRALDVLCIPNNKTEVGGEISFEPPDAPNPGVGEWEEFSGKILIPFSSPFEVLPSEKYKMFQQDAPFVEALDSSNFLNRLAALCVEKMIPTLCGMEKTASLITALKHNIPYFRSRAAIALRKMKDPRVVKPLIESLDDPDEDVRKEAQKTLKKLTRQNFGAERMKWQEWWENNKSTH